MADLHPSVGEARQQAAELALRAIGTNAVPYLLELLQRREPRLLSELRELIDRQETLALESTLSGKTYVKIFKEAKQRGYRIDLHFVWIPDVREAIRRVRQRVIEGGHDVPVEDIKRRFARSIQHLLDDYAPLANKWFLWDNSTPPAKLLAESTSQSIIQLRTFFSFHEEKSA